MRTIDLGLVHSSQAENLITVVLNRLRQDGDVETGISPNFLLRNWPPAFTEWSTKSVRDAFFASPQFPRLLEPEAIRDTIARGVEAGQLAYVGKSSDGGYEPFVFKDALNPGDVEISDDMFIITGDEAKKNIEPPKLTTLSIDPDHVQVEPSKKQAFAVAGHDQHSRPFKVDKVLWKATGGSIDGNGVFHAGDDEGSFLVSASAGDVTASARVDISTKPRVETVTKEEKPIKKGVLRWQGEVPSQKWMNFYTKVLSRFARGGGLKLTVSVEIAPEGGVSEQNVDETRVALRELGLDDDVEAS